MDDRPSPEQIARYWSTTPAERLMQRLIVERRVAGAWVVAA